MSRPKVSFVVPCYKLAHLLEECVGSILAQSFEDLEVLVMDDCSPDATPEVAASFRDDRVVHVRHQQNLGHLRNYNVGIERARGDYVWLISADDKLRSREVLRRYLELLEARPEVGYAICPAVFFDDGGRELQLYASLGPGDRIFAGHDFLVRHLALGNCVSAPSGLVRKACYDREGAFPLDLPFAGDWYLWALFALEHDVAYFGEPMVGYRKHELNMTKDFHRRSAALRRDEVAVRFRILRHAERRGHARVARAFSDAIAEDLAMRAARSVADPDWPYGIGAEELEGYLTEHATPGEAAQLQARVQAAVGDLHYDRGEHEQARRCYDRSLSLRPDARTRLKRALVAVGGPGRLVRSGLNLLRGR